MFMVPLVAGLWFLLLAVGVIVEAVSGSAFSVALFFVGIALIVAGLRMVAGNASAVRWARRSAVFGLTVAVFPGVLVVLDFAFSQDLERLSLASDVLRWSAAGAIPALAVLLTCREKRTKVEQA